MKRRFNLNKQGLLEDREGNVIGRLTSLTFEVKGGILDVPVTGGYGGVVEEPPTTEIENDERGVGKTDADRDPVERIWTHYLGVMNPRRTELDPESRKIIAEALKVATAEDCMRAIDGNGASKFHQGQNPRRRKYNSLSQILKGKRAAGVRSTGQTTRERIDFFIDLADQAGGPPVVSADPARVSTAKVEVMDAWLYAGDESVVRRGEEAALWLAEAGIQVLEDPSETNKRGLPKPRFEVTP